MWILENRWFRNYVIWKKRKEQQVNSCCCLHRNVSGMISQYTNIFGAAGINIANMTNNSKGEYAYALLDIDSPATDEVLAKLAATEGVIHVRKVKSNNISQEIL